MFSNLTDIINEYGPKDPYKYKNGHANEPKAELTLVRQIEEIYNGATPPGGIWCKRLVESGAVKSVSNSIDINKQTVIVAPEVGATVTGSDVLDAAGETFGTVAIND